MTARAPTPTFKAPANPAGVWSPGLKVSPEKSKESPYVSQELKKKDEPIPPIWTPRSAGSSPVAERKEFRPVSFESPVLGRKNKSESQESGNPLQQVSESSGDIGVALSSTLERRLPTSHSAPASGFSDFSAPRLPRAQNPTITLLQRAREGQLPKGASYLKTESNYSIQNKDRRSATLGSEDVLYHQMKNEYTTESDGERSRRMADITSRNYEIGATTKDGMPLVLRSEIKDGNQSRWYRKMYDTIHKQKPDRNYVTVRYKQRRARYPYTSGYFSEPEHNAFSADYYDSDGTIPDTKYATLDRRRIQSTTIGKENKYMSSTMPRSENTINSATIAPHNREAFKNQPGRIENYVPGRSSISEKEAKEWWDEVMDIFDGHLEQQKHMPHPRSFMNQALKESGYESDSTLIFRRREDNIQQLSPSEQREVYKNIQKGGDVPLRGLRKPAPERPKEETEIEYFPLSPTLTRIRIHKTSKPQNQVLCYPLTIPPHPRHIFSEYKRSAPSFASLSPTPTLPHFPPLPPKRRSSRNNNTLRLITSTKVALDKSPTSKRHETCFASISNIEKSKTKHSKDKVISKLSPIQKRKIDVELRTKAKINKPLNASLSLKSQTLDINASKGYLSRSCSASPIRKVSKPLTTPALKKPANFATTKAGAYGSERCKLIASKNAKLSRSTELFSLTEAKKAAVSHINSLHHGTTYKKSNTLYSSVKNGLNSAKDKSLPIQVGFSQSGKELLKQPRASASLPTTPTSSRVNRNRGLTPSSSISDKLEKSQSPSLESLKSSKVTKKDSSTLLKQSLLNSPKQSRTPKPKLKNPATPTDTKKIRKSKKDQLNGEIAKRDKRYKTGALVKSARVAENTRNMQFDPSENIYELTQDAIQKQRDAIQTNSFFQHLFWKDIPSPLLSVASQNSWIAEKTRLLQRHGSSFSEPTIGALKIYLNHTRPVSDSRFRSLDAALVRSRSTSPKSVTWDTDRVEIKSEKSRSVSLPPKIVFTETSRPVSPVIVRKRKEGPDKYKKELIRSSPTRLVFSETSRPISPTVQKWYPSYKDEICPSSLILPRQTARARSPTKETKRASRKDLVYVSGPLRSDGEISDGKKLYFTETCRPVSPIVEKRVLKQNSGSSGYQKKFALVKPVCASYNLSEDILERDRSFSPPSRLYFSETSRPISPVVERKYSDKETKQPRLLSPISKLYFSETSRPISPVLERKAVTVQKQELVRSFPEKLFFTETSRPISPVLRKSRSVTPPFSKTLHYMPTRTALHKKADYGIGGVSRQFDDDCCSTVSSEIPHKECRTYYIETFHSPQRCTKFKELNKFYSTLERMGELERTTSSAELRPRGKHEDEIIDYDRWKEVHLRERAERELETLYLKLKDDQKEKGFLFCPKDVTVYKWKKELDRGLRNKDKSVRNIKDNFERLKLTTKPDRLPVDVAYRRELYKPLWRGNSVADLASGLSERRSQSEGRVTSMRKKLLESQQLLTHGIGSRIWSSLSSEQIDLLKGQLAEIYSQNGQKTYHETSYDYGSNISDDGSKTYKESLKARKDSDEPAKLHYTAKPIKTFDVMSSSVILSENDKKRLSHSLSKEVMDRVSQRHKRTTSPSLVLGKETRGAIATAEARTKSTVHEMALPKACYSSERSGNECGIIKKDLLILDRVNIDDFKNNNNNVEVEKWTQPKKALVSTDVTNRVTSASETESGSTEGSTKTVIYTGNKDVQKKVEYFEQVAEEQPYTPTIYRAADNNIEEEPETDTEHELETNRACETRKPPRKLVLSQSFQDFKELFGEQLQRNAGFLLNSDVNGEYDSNGNIKITNAGEVSHLKNKFEQMNKPSNIKPFRYSLRRSRSDSELHRKNQIFIPGQSIGEVDSLRRKYEYPWIFNRGRSRVRRGGMVSPIYFRAEDRYMPHINIISKIASLYPKKTVFLSDAKQGSSEDLARVLGLPLGEVERLRQKFDCADKNISLLGHMFTSFPNIHELRDIAPYLTGSWTAHKYPKMQDNTRSLSSPEDAPSSWDTSLVRKVRPRPKSVSPPRHNTKYSPISSNQQRVSCVNGSASQTYNPKIHQPVGRYQPPCPTFAPVRYKSSWPHTSRPSVSFKGVVYYNKQST